MTESKETKVHVEEETWEEANISAADYTPHSSRRIHYYLAPGSPDNHNYIEIQSVDTSKLSLLDVCNYTIQDHRVDGSGHCVWMGALFFVHALSISQVTSTPWNLYLRNRRVAEMGCGTGTAGIAMMKISKQQSESDCVPASTFFLDNDPEALELCRTNCQHNQIDESRYQIQLQEPWTDLSLVSDDMKESENFSFDTILATDVLYDLKIIRPFLQTSYRFLKKSSRSNQYLILSHVPRWFLPRENNEENADSNYNPSRALEQHILREADKIGFRLRQTVRPRDVQQQLLEREQIGGSTSQSELLDSLQEMEEANAVLLILELAGT